MEKNYNDVLNEKRQCGHCRRRRNTPIQAIYLEGLEPISIVKYDDKSKAYLFTETAITIFSESTGISEDLLRKTRIYKGGNLGGGGTTYVQTIHLDEKYYAAGGDFNSVINWLNILAHEIGHLPQAARYKALYKSKMINGYFTGFGNALLYHNFFESGSKSFFDDAHDRSPYEIEAETYYDNYIKWREGFGQIELFKILNNDDLNDSQKNEKIKEKTTPKPSTKKTTKPKATKKGGAYDKYNKGKQGGGVKKNNPKQ